MKNVTCEPSRIVDAVVCASGLLLIFQSETVVCVFVFEWNSLFFSIFINEKICEDYLCRRASHFSLIFFHCVSLDMLG